MRSLFLTRPTVGQCEQLFQVKSKTRKKIGGVDLVFREDALPGAPAACGLKDGQAVLESVENPILPNSAAQILVALGLVIAFNVAFAGGNEFHDNGRRFVPFGKPAQSGPNHPIGAPPIIAGLNNVLMDRE